MLANAEQQFNVRLMVSMSVIVEEVWVRKQMCDSVFIDLLAEREVNEGEAVFFFYNHQPYDSEPIHDSAELWPDLVICVHIWTHEIRGCFNRC